MKKNNRVKFLKEDVVNQVTLQQLLDMSSKVQIALLPLVDECLKFNNTELKRLSTRANSSVGELSEAIRNLIIGSSENEALPKRLDVNDKEGQNVIESVTNSIMESLKPLFESFGASGEDTFLTPENDETKAAKKVKGVSPNAFIPKKEKTEEKVEDEINESEEETEVEESSEKQNIDVKQPIDNIINVLDDEQFKSFKADMLDALKTADVDNEEFAKILMELEATKSVDEFNTCLNKVYDFADENDFILTINE